MCVCVTSCSCCCQICDRVVCVCGSFVRRRLSMTFELVGICVRYFFFVGSVLFIVGKLYEAFCAKLCLCNSG